MKNLVNKILEWLRADGVLHLGVSALLTIILGSFLPIWVAAVIVAAIGAGKEIYDLAHPDTHSADWHDIICDLIGIALGCLVWVMYLIF